MNSLFNFSARAVELQQQLADFMNDKGPGFQLFKNAYAIHNLSGGKKDSMIAEIDRLVGF